MWKYIILRFWQIGSLLMVVVSKNRALMHFYRYFSKMVLVTKVFSVFVMITFWSPDKFGVN